MAQPRPASSHLYARQLEKIERIAQKLKLTPSSHRLTLDPDDIRATIDCNNVMESALSNLAVGSSLVDQVSQP